jgi:polyisoprenyl-teichoic acid--peptidoglycan teichoic acid transferase
VRYRHGDNDLVRAARQQDFLRQVRNAAGARRLLNYRKRRDLAKLFARYTDTDKGLRRKKDVFSLLKLVLFTGRKPVREVRFRVDRTDDPVYLTASQDKLDKTANEFLNAQASNKPRTTSRASEADRKSASNRKSRNRAADVRGLEVARREGEDQAIVGTRRAKFPFYFPTLRYRGSRYAGTEPRIYRIEDEKGKMHRAYRLVVSKGVVGEYYGIQGTTWREPPILDDPSETRKVNGRKLELHYDGRRLRLVAWRTKRAVYWVSNTLTQSLGTQQMIGIAASLQRLGQK